MAAPTPHLPWLSLHSLALNFMASSDSHDFTHVRDGQSSMVDVSGKVPNKRTAVAAVKVELDAEIIGRFENNDLHGPQGPVLQTSIIDGTMAVWSAGRSRVLLESFISRNNAPRGVVFIFADASTKRDKTFASSGLRDGFGPSSPGGSD